MGHGGQRRAAGLTLVATTLREPLLRLAPGLWRHRRPALAVAWTICLVGWTGALLLPDAAGGAPDAVRPRQLESGSQPIAALEGDLAAAGRRRAQAGRLAATPALLAGRANPLHAQVAAQLQQQEASIAVLQARLTAARSGAKDLREPPAATADPGQRPLAPSGEAPPREPMPRSRLGLLCSILAIALAAAAATAGWRARRDGIIDRPAQPAPRLGLTLLGTLAIPASPEARRRDQRSRLGVALAGLALLGRFGAVAAVDALAPPAALVRGRAHRGTAEPEDAAGVKAQPAPAAASAAFLCGRALSREARDRHHGCRRLAADANPAKRRAGIRPRRCELDQPIYFRRTPTPPPELVVERASLVPGYLDPASGRPLLGEALAPVCRALLARAGAPQAGRRGRLILVSSRRLARARPSSPSTSRSR